MINNQKILFKFIRMNNNIPKNQRIFRILNKNLKK